MIISSYHPKSGYWNFNYSNY